jgi:hypothetical protein
MSSRWNANTLLLAVFVLILVGAGVDYGRRVLGGTKDAANADAAAKKPLQPDFKVGDPAPDFALPDSKKKIHRLSELVHGKTLLFFACGCSNCRQVQTWLADMRKDKGDIVPPVITITSAPPESEAAWFRDTGLKQTILYYTHGATPDPMTIYKGKPCPRMYLVNGDRTVDFIGASPAETPGIQAIGMQIAKKLGGTPTTTEDMLKRMNKPKQEIKSPPKPLPTLPPYAQPQSSLPGA